MCAWLLWLGCRCKERAGCLLFVVWVGAAGRAGLCRSPRLVLHRSPRPVCKIPSAGLRQLCGRLGVVHMVSAECRAASCFDHCLLYCTHMLQLLWGPCAPGGQAGSLPARAQCKPLSRQPAIGLCLAPACTLAGPCWFLSAPCMQDNTQQQARIHHESYESSMLLLCGAAVYSCMLYLCRCTSAPTCSAS